MLEVAIRIDFPAFSLAADFTAPNGITAISGRSGAGKTSLINALAGLVEPTDGRILLDDRVLFDRRVNLPPEKRRLGYVFQEDRLFPHLTVEGNLRYGWSRTAASDRRIPFDEVAATLGLLPLLNRRPRTLSGGEKQRVAIGRALLMSPRLLLMDEPLANLDRQRKSEILPLIECLPRQFGVSVIYVSHAPEEILRLADHLIILEQGAVAAAGPVEQLMSRLDLRPLTGRAEAGAVMPAEVLAHDERFALSELKVASGTMTVARLDLPVGAALRVRIRARDVALALSPPADISMLNRFVGRIVEIADSDGPQADILVDIGEPLWARVTRRAVSDLGLEVGTTVHALIKTVSIDRHSLGQLGDGARLGNNAMPRDRSESP